MCIIFINTNVCPFLTKENTMYSPGCKMRHLMVLKVMLHVSVKYMQVTFKKNCIYMLKASAYICRNRNFRFGKR